MYPQMEKKLFTIKGNKIINTSVYLYRQVSTIRKAPSCNGDSSRKLSKLVQYSKEILRIVFVFSSFNISVYCNGTVIQSNDDDRKDSAVISKIKRFPESHFLEPGMEQEMAKKATYV